MTIKRKLTVAFIAVLVALSMSSCKSDTTQHNTEETEEETTTSSPPEESMRGYSIVSKTFNKENAEIPKIYITTAQDPNKEEYCAASIKISDNSGQYTEINSDNVSITVRGHTTANGAKKPYNIKFTEKVNILGMGYSKKWCLLADLFDPTLMRNSLVLDFARNMGLQYTSKCEYVEVFYNGVDKGVYLLCTPVSEGKDKVDLDLSENDYLLQLQPNYEYSDKIKVTTNSGIMLSVEEGNTDDLTYLNNLLADFETSIAYGVEEIKEYADVDSFVDHYIINEIVKDVDFATSSLYFYVKNGKIYAGPVWDFDLSMGNIDKEYYSSYSGGKFDYEGFYCRKLWYYYLMQIPEFQKMVEQRYRELQPLIVNLTTDNELGINRIDDILNKYGSDFKNNFVIWGEGKRYGINGKAPLATYEENVEYLRQWLINRNNWLNSRWNDSQGAE